ncbi:MAG: DUF433 domain-containing protein [Thermoguttaceae bacterium]
MDSVPGRESAESVMVSAQAHKPLQLLVEVPAMVWQDRITIDPHVLVGKPIVKGTRISVEFVIDLLARGWTNEQILKEYDHLTPEDVQACLAYASDVLKSERVYLLPTPCARLDGCVGSSTRTFLPRSSVP